MKAIIATLSLAFLLTACVPQNDTPAADSGSMQEVASVSAVTVETSMDDSIGEPNGHIVTFTGDFNESFSFIFPEEDSDVEEALISGEETYVEGYYFAGLQSDLVFVRDGDTLQIQEQVTTEDGEEAPRTVLETIELPEGLELSF